MLKPNVKVLVYDSFVQRSLHEPYITEVFENPEVLIIRTDQLERQSKIFDVYLEDQPSTIFDCHLWLEIYRQSVIYIIYIQLAELCVYSSPDSAYK